MDRPFTDEARATLREREAAALGRRYDPRLHLVGATGIAVAVAVAAALGLDRVSGAEWLVVPVTYILANAAEWRIHRDLLHRRVRGFEWLYERHTLMHHRVFVAWDLDVRSAREWGLVLMPPLAVVLLCLATVPVALGIAALGQPDAARLFAITGVGYVVSYEWLHLAYHQPPSTAVGRLSVVRWLRRHHQVHHHPAQMGTRNFNVTVPLWDHVRSTVAPRGATGTSVAPARRERG
ncbi:MAG: sterol desaturase family protein [Myxococcota bacterium]